MYTCPLFELCTSPATARILFLTRGRLIILLPRPLYKCPRPPTVELHRLPVTRFSHSLLNITILLQKCRSTHAAFRPQPFLQPWKSNSCLHRPRMMTLSSSPRSRRADRNRTGSGSTQKATHQLCRRKKMIPTAANRDSRKYNTGLVCTWPGCKIKTGQAHQTSLIELYCADFCS